LINHNQVFFSHFQIEIIYSSTNENQMKRENAYGSNTDEDSNM